MPAAGVDGEGAALAGLTGAVGSTRATPSPETVAASVRSLDALARSVANDEAAVLSRVTEIARLVPSLDDGVVYRIETALPPSSETRRSTQAFGSPWTAKSRP